MSSRRVERKAPTKKKVISKHESESESDSESSESEEKDDFDVNNIYDKNGNLVVLPMPEEIRRTQKGLPIEVINLRERSDTLTYYVIQTSRLLRKEKNKEKKKELTALLKKLKREGNETCEKMEHELLITMVKLRIN